MVFKHESFHFSNLCFQPCQLSQFIIQHYLEKTPLFFKYLIFRAVLSLWENCTERTELLFTYFPHPIPHIVPSVITILHQYDTFVATRPPHLFISLDGFLSSLPLSFIYRKLFPQGLVVVPETSETPQLRVWALELDCKILYSCSASHCHVTVVTLSKFSVPQEQYYSLYIIGISDECL